MQIKDIATIRTGVYLRPEEYKDIVYLQVKDFNERGDYIGVANPNIFDKKIPEHHLLKDGDILFAAKGSKNFATVYRGSDLPAVASSVFFVLSLTEDIIPEYVAWFINQTSSQKQLKSEAMGTSMLSISIGSISELEIIIPDYRTQKIIVELDRLRSKERYLYQELISKRQKLLDIKIFLFIKNQELNNAN